MEVQENKYRKRCKNCTSCIKGYFKSLPEHYVCTGVKEPFIISNINCLCTEYEEQKVWSWNEQREDYWNRGIFYSKNEAIKDAIDDYKTNGINNPIIYVAECFLIPPPTHVDADIVLEYLDESYNNETGCEEYIYDNIADSDIKWLENKMSDLINEFNERINLNPNWFNIYEIEEVDLSKIINGAG